MNRLLLFAVPLLLMLALMALSATTPGPEELRSAYAKPPSEWPAATVDEGVDFKELGTLPPVVYPAHNPYNKAKAALGEMLFFDPRLSGSNQIACASCHDPEVGWGDGRRTSFGHGRQLGPRNAPTLLNVGHWLAFFWDGRAQSLEEQALFPIKDPLEMNQDLASLPSELEEAEGYAAHFAEAFGDSSITVERIAQALATYERGIRSRKSRFDQFVEGRYTALTDEELAGLHLFRTKARCINCHHGPFFTDQAFHNNGQSHFGRPGEDLGRFAITGDTLDMGLFRTPTLRDIAFTGPYMHHGNIAELEEVLFMYDQGMPQIIPRSVKSAHRPVHDPLLKPLGLTARERAQLLSFLQAVSVRPRPVNPPGLPI